ncbi:uncharacterized protein [Paramisgurnus dabryanus]|uniref:uncharacterized protein n=1 Tax=Paramisgurnus dabryanus TaxID=90735 RepID=UPI0031F393FB
MTDFLDYDDCFVADPEPYLFEPEYTEEELAFMDREREERSEPEQTGAGERTRANSNWWCKCDCCGQIPTEIESLCCLEWDQVWPSMVGVNVYPEDPGHIACVAASDAFAAMIHPAVVNFFFQRDKANWKKHPTPSGPDGKLSSDQNRLVSYRIVLEWALQGETLGRGHRKPLPLCVVGAIRQRYPSESGVYVGFQEGHEAMDL